MKHGQHCIKFRHNLALEVVSLHTHILLRHHKPQGLGHLARSVSRVTAALANVSSVSQLLSFLVECSGMILNGFGFVAFFAGVKKLGKNRNAINSTIIYRYM
jgi:hypothetical protein